MDGPAIPVIDLSDESYQVLVVDDDELHLSLQVEILREIPCRVTSTDCGSKALQLIEQGSYDLVLLDKRLPDLDGDEVCLRIRRDLNNHLLPIIMVTGDGTSESLRHSLAMGANDFIKKPYDPLEFLSRARAALEKKQLFDQLDHAASVLFTLAKMVEARDPTTGEHCNRLVHTCQVIGREVGLAHDELEALRKGAILHDIGKIGIPDTILLKPGKLSADEWLTMQRHAEVGADLCNQLNSVRDAVPIVRHHHERWDGSGYPDGLSGRRIPLIARVFQYADIYDALRHDRVYSRAQTVERIIHIMESELDKGWRDPEIGEIFLRILRRSPELLDR
ncbi:MAG: response regulator [Candidatus Thiodiazotropha sp. (ex Epidulcina cf. delphinae)]|nr:response regulator [Candidatus Thiodiazotropha sp. (ex Epidulcina cf. delphinae)]